MFDAMRQDLMYAARRLRNAPGFTLTVAMTLALGIGATTGIFSVVYGVLLKPLPYPEPGRLAAVWEVNSRGAYSRLADPNFDDFRTRNHTFEAMAKYASTVASVIGPGEPTRSDVAIVTREFFRVLGVQPAIGRAFGADDARRGASPVVLVSYQYWKEHLGGSPDLRALALRIEDRVYSVVGVLPTGFRFPAKAALWVPAELDEENTSRTSHNFYAVGRLRRGVSASAASADLDAIAQAIVAQSVERSEYLLKGAAAVPLQVSQTANVRSPLLVLLGAVGVLLLVACANVANLLTAEASRRTRELAVRTALGAGRWRLVRQFIGEAILLSAISGIAGVLIALALVRALLALAPPDLPRLQDVAVSWPVLAFAAAISLLTATVLGVFTALRATSSAPAGRLIEGGRGGTPSRRTQRVGRAIVASQLAMTIVLLTGAGLLGRSLLQVLSVDPGFRTEHILAADLDLPDAANLQLADASALRARRSQLIARLIQRLHSIRGVGEVAAVNEVPLGEGLPDGMFLVVSPEENPKNLGEYLALAKQEERRGTADFCAASPEYFAALGIPLRRGRLFDDRDGFDAPHAALITESLARLRWPNQDPIGRTIQFGNMDGDLHLLTVVGVVADTRDSSLETPPRPTVYVNLLQRPRSRFTIVMHGKADQAQVTAAARAILREEVREVPPRFRSFEQIYSASIGSRRFNLTLVGVFALTALLLAAGGVYSVVAYGTAQRTQEIGVRMAMGARSADVTTMILRRELRTTVTGVAVGIVAALGAAQATRSLLFGVEPTDPLTFAAVSVALVTVAGLASYLPARRAARLDPMAALRGE